MGGKTGGGVQNERARAALPRLDSTPILSGCSKFERLDQSDGSLVAMSRLLLTLFEKVRR